MDQLAPFEVPAKVHFCDALPRTMMGKVLRRELRTRVDVWAEAGDAGEEVLARTP